MEDLDEFIIVTSRVIDLSKSLAEPDPSEPSLQYHCVEFSNDDRANRVRHALKEWVVQNGLQATCQELLPVLKQGGFEGIAVYIEECLRSNSLEMLDHYELNEEDAGKLSNHFLQLSNSNLDTTSDENTRLCIQNDESESEDPSEEGTNRTNKEPPPDILDTTVAKYTKAIFLASILLAIIGLCTLGGAILLAIISLSHTGTPSNGGGEFFILNNTSPMVLLAQPSTTPQTITEWEQCIARSELVEGQIKVSHKFVNESTVDWTEEVLDFCETPGRSLKVLQSSLDNFNSHASSLPKIICPENVRSLEFHFDTDYVTDSVSRMVQLLHSFCNLNALKVSSSVEGKKSSCTKLPKEMQRQRNAQLISLKYIKWQNFSGCDSVFSIIMSSIQAPVLSRLDFICVSLSRRNQQETENLIATSNHFNTIHCADSNLCNSLNLKLNSHISINTSRIQCHISTKTLIASGVCSSRTLRSAFIPNRLKYI